MAGNPLVDVSLTTHRNVAAQVEYAPDAPALSASGRTLTYVEVYERASVLACAIEDTIGTAADGDQKPLALCISDPLANDVAMLAAWMAGHFVSCIDVHFPRERIDTLLNALVPACVITDTQASYPLTRRSSQPPVLRIGDMPDNSAGLVPPDVTQDAESISMVSYTSGSTGTPKGVVQTHARMTRDSLIVDHLGVEPPADAARATTFPTHSYANLAQIANALRRGGHGFHYDLATLDLPDLARAMRDDNIAQVLFAPTMVRRIFANLDPDMVFPQLANVNVAGEPLLASDVALMQPHMPDGCLLLNTYAASEVGGIAHSIYVFGTSERFEDALWLDDEACNQSVSIVNERDEPVEPGQIGEMVVQGRWMARGYWIDGSVQRFEANAEESNDQESNDPEWNDPGLNDPESKTQTYRTGDLFKLRDDGRCRYIGRRDFAISIGGHLIHPAEIEAAILDHPTVSQASVCEQTHPVIGPVIVAYVAGQHLGPAEIGAIRSSLALRLPVHLLPFEYLVLDGIPRTEGGKVDKSRLPVPSWSAHADQEPRNSSGPPVTETEQLVARVWGEVIGDVPVLRDSNFFALGGTSLRALELIRQFARDEKREVALPVIYAFPVLADFAAYLDGEVAMEQVFGSTICVQPGGRMTPFFCVHGEVERLATQTSRERPVYRLTVVHGEAPPNVSSLAEQARTHVTDMQTLYPDESPVIGGFSYGAYVALEMARLLEAQGRPPALVVLLDPLWLPGNEGAANVPPECADKLNAAIASAPRFHSLRTNIGRVQRRIARYYRGRQLRRAEQGKTKQLSTAALENRNMLIFGDYALAHEFSAITSPVLFVVPDKTRHEIRRDVGGWVRFCHGPFDVLKIRSARLHADLFDDAAITEIATGIEKAVVDA